MSRIIRFIGLLSFSSVALADYGLTQTGTQAEPLRLDGPGKELRIPWTSPFNGTLDSASFLVSSTAQAPAYELALYPEGTDPDKEPSAHAGSLVPRPSSWAVFPLRAAPVVQGGRYQLVLRWDSRRGGIHGVGENNEGHWASFCAFRPGDGKAPAEFGFARGASLPVFFLSGSGNYSGGSVWKGDLELPIPGFGARGRRYPSQVLHFNCGTKAASLRARVRKRGDPKAPLVAVIWKHDYHAHKVTRLAEVKLAEAGAVGSSWAWSRQPCPKAPRTTLPNAITSPSAAPRAARARRDVRTAISSRAWRRRQAPRASRT